MARAGNTKKTSKFVVRKAAGSSAGKKTVSRSRTAAGKSTARKTSSKPAKKSKILSLLSSRIKSVRGAFVKAAKKPARKLTSAKKSSAVKIPAKKALKKTALVKKAVPVKKTKAVKKTVPLKKKASAPVLEKKLHEKPLSRPQKMPAKLSRKEVQKTEAPKVKAALPAAEKKTVRRVKATDRSRGLAKKEAKVPFGDLRVAIVKKPVYSKIAEAQNRKPAAARKASPVKMAVKKRAAVPEAPAAAPAPVPAREFPQELPSNYGDNLIYLMVRDPHWIYAYWELQKDYVEGSRESLGGTWGEICTVLRVYDVTDSQSEPAYQDLYLGGITDHWHINAVPDRSYFVEIGLLHKDGRFLSLARSNPVSMPRDSMSDILDEEWMDIDFDKVYALSGGFDVGKSSQELRKLMQDRMQGNASSGSGSGVGIVTSMSSPGSGSWGGHGAEAMKARKFFFWLDCEVIVYGGTEPDAKVTFQGKVIKLRPDGTFSFRFALPDGHFVFDAKAESSDGIEERVITPVVQRETSRPAPVFKQGKV